MQRLLSETRPWRHVTRPVVLRKGNAIHTGQDALPAPPSLPTLENASQSDLARTWIEKFKSREIPKSLVEFTYSRSSGPGGQNVNKVNTKATLRCPIDAPWIPLWAREYLKKTPAYTSSSQTILLTSTAHRSQAQNVQDCLAKLHSLIVSAASAGLVNEPSEVQQERVRQLVRAEKARRRQDKDKRKEVKRGRSGGRADWD
ncbi:hypothetical protein L226DRAFT_63688 [Lentinus tigrinus ALCF2SS1-7]|uniref:Prokaryotic-type class I peptide chain release factors domain-containing protein n=1 Tax=Lentinus tigrinus ALCF2SS1-6 TaxID=1328759 RepID=A0A5C2S8F5_9APHY|nr:hypothetical protein L227DRAFT_104164 [Lentinus tigrinus ALCF2SS1-6]RPD74733.1 hypothetical protein L226DRAFT_63688 [Lentinus tigrinus ALCF2SS1-7]